MAIVDPFTWIIFSAGLLIGWGISFFTSYFLNLDSRLQDLRIRTNKITEEQAFIETTTKYNYVKFCFLVTFLLITILFLVAIFPSLIYSQAFSNATSTNLTSMSPFDLIHDIVSSNAISMIIGVLSGVIASLMTANYISKKQRADIINDDLRKCLNDLIENRQRLTEEKIAVQFQRIREIANKKKVLAQTNPNEAMRLWAAFEKDEFDFSYTNYHQYFLVDNLDYFLRIRAHHYPKKYDLMKPKFRAMMELLRIFVNFNSQLQSFEIDLRNTLNSLIENGNLDEETFETCVNDNIRDIDQFYRNTLVNILQNYSTINPDSYEDIAVHVSWFSEEVY
jgi:hypothetical protein